MTMTVEPIYGNGWTDGQSDVPEPSPFTVDARRAENGAISGRILASADARFVGARFEATLRHMAPDPLYNCQIECEEGITLWGYCKIA